MKLRFLILLLAAVFVGLPALAHAQRAVLLLRHADRLDQPEDSPLSKSGEARAQALAALLKDAGITTIYTSELQRTIKTAEPLSRALNIKPVIMPVLDRDGLFKRIQAENGGDVVLIVGHDRSVPAMLKLFGHPQEIKIGPNEYDNLFVLVPKGNAPPTVLRLRY